ncbi:S8/S53 family peptidase [Actinocrinis sp.]|uniref:S8 family peptidase n=1 Tax=Actinocrinis sp. TaxID=1920516 RepID=UPI002D49A2E6|nr:S8/S53 family peptidase [Actinocrinis sp.]HZP50696.1 S8/S53 family peptidase [Actinocrinis sp.]
MTLDRQARLERLLARHRDAVLSEGPNGTSALHRKDQLLVAARHADRAHAAVERFTERRDDLLEVGVTRLHLRPGAGVEPLELLGQLRTHSDGPMAVSLNHLLRGEPNYDGGPYGLPKPCAPMPKPTAVDTSARRVFAGVIDTGIVSHPWFTGSDWFAQVSPDQLDPIPAEVDYELETQTGHGTFVAGTLLRQAPTAFLMIERALGDDGVGDELELLRALSRLRSRLSSSEETLDVLNLSLGGYTVDDEPSPLLAEALGRFGKQTVIVVAAGNSGSNRPFWPATLKSCVAVGALETDGARRAEFSNHGWWVDACSVGANVCGPFIDDGHEFFGFAEWSGTSFAAPRVAGAIAGFAASKHLSAVEAAESLLDTASRQCHPDFGVVVE